MESLYKVHNHLMKNTYVTLRRKIMDEINWNARLIAIKGFRGSGKTNLLLRYAKEYYSNSDRRCLYINMNNFYFSVKTIVDFANEFQLKGGEVLMIDQAFKYPRWIQELSYCYDRFPKLKIIFTCPVAMQLDEEPLLRGKVKEYNISGFSFREFIELQTQHEYPVYSLEDILENHEDIANQITNDIRPLAYLDDYLEYGFCPFHLEKHNFIENLLERINTMLEVDLVAINRIDQNYLPKIRKLLYMLSLIAPCNPNVSQLSTDIELSRATVMNYIKFLEDSKIINLLYFEGEKYPKKPAQIYINNPNLLFVTHASGVDKQVLSETFFYNQVSKKSTISMGHKKSVQFIIDKQYHFSIGSGVRGKFNPDVYYAISGIECGEKKVIPLWLFGFLY